jgi:hypothetical protein
VEARDVREGGPCATAFAGGSGWDVEGDTGRGAAETAVGTEKSVVEGSAWACIWWENGTFGGIVGVRWLRQADVCETDEGFLVESFCDTPGEEDVFGAAGRWRFGCPGGKAEKGWVEVPAGNWW